MGKRALRPSGNQASYHLSLERGMQKFQRNPSLIHRRGDKKGTGGPNNIRTHRAHRRFVPTIERRV